MQTISKQGNKFHKTIYFSFQNNQICKMSLQIAVALYALFWVSRRSASATSFWKPVLIDQAN